MSRNTTYLKLLRNGENTWKINTVQAQIVQYKVKKQDFLETFSTLIGSKQKQNVLGKCLCRVFLYFHVLLRFIDSKIMLVALKTIKMSPSRQYLRLWKAVKIIKNTTLFHIHRNSSTRLWKTICKILLKQLHFHQSDGQWMIIIAIEMYLCITLIYAKRRKIS